MLWKWMQNNFLVSLCLLQSLPIPLRWKQTRDNLNCCGVCFPDTGNWNFRTSKSTDPRSHPSTKRTTSSARCNPICGQAPGASRTHGTFPCCLSSHHLWESSAVLVIVLQNMELPRVYLKVSSGTSTSSVESCSSSPGWQKVAYQLLAHDQVPFGKSLNRFQ